MPLCRAIAMPQGAHAEMRGKLAESGRKVCGSARWARHAAHHGRAVPVHQWLADLQFCNRAASVPDLKFVNRLFVPLVHRVQGGTDGQTWTATRSLGD